MNRSTTRILVVDDDEMTLQLHCLLLMQLSFLHVETQDTCEAALAQLNSVVTTPDIILLDLNMPHMDGAEFLRHLANRRFEGGLILISGEDQRILGSAEKLGRTLGLRLLGNLEKPVSKQALEVLLERMAKPGKKIARTNLKQYNALELRRAIDNDELCNHYQPQVAFSDGEFVAVEALVRWQHTEDGMVYPDAFISLAESHGLIDALAKNVIEQALYDISAWQSRGLTPRVAVNLSMDNLCHPGFADFITQKCSQAGVDTRRIVFEVTESRVMSDRARVLEAITRLRLRRFGLSIDDFGTGHSSLAQLRDIPFDELKIDRGFVHNSAANDTLRSILEASLSLARNLKMHTVAEGIENSTDWEFLRQLGCEFAQGYFIARPMPATALLAWVEPWRERAKLLCPNIDHR